MQLITFALDFSFSSGTGTLTEQQSVNTEKTTSRGERCQYQGSRRVNQGTLTSISFPGRMYFLEAGMSNKYKNANDIVSESS